MSVTSSFFVFLLNFDFAIAKLSYQPLSPLPETTVSGKVIDLGIYITGIYKIAIGSAIVLAVIMLIFAGLEWMTSGAVGKKEDAIKKINAALFGLLLTLGSWLFLNTINPAAVNFNLNLTEIIIVDSSAPIIGGYYCQLEENGPYYGPYSTEESCVANTECVTTGTYGENRYCLKMGPEWQGGPTGVGLDDEILIDEDNFFDTGITIDDKFIKLKGPGIYFNVDIYVGILYDRSEQRGPYKTKQECVDAKTAIETGGNDTERAKEECYFVEWGINDYLLNKILANEDYVRKELKEKSDIDVSTSENTDKRCKYVGDTACTNVGDLYIKVINTSLKNLKTVCDDWAKTNEKGDCKITTTGGTEWWLHGNRSLDINKNNSTNHKSYSYNPSFGRTVDLRLDPVLTEFIKTKHIGPPTDNPLGKIYVFSGPTVVSSGRYLEELKDGIPNHWHVDFNI